MKVEELAAVGEIGRVVAVANGTESGLSEWPRPGAAATRLGRGLMRSNPSAADIQLLFALFNSASDNDLHK